MPDFITALLIFLTGGVFIRSLAATPVWGTFRPHALISARARIPHSPFFGFAYHPANSLEVRNLASDHQGKISSFSWSAHDGANFGDQQIRDQDANLLITTNFYAHPSQPACTIRISAVPLNPDKHVPITSVVLYAVTAPDDQFDDANITSASWGSLRLANADAPPSKDSVRILGESKAVGGRFTIRLSPPLFGTVTADSLNPRLIHQDPKESLSGTGSRCRLRLRSQRPKEVPDELNSFRTSAVLTANHHEAWAVEKNIERKLTRSLDLPDDFGAIHLLDSEPPSAASSLLVQRLVQIPFQLEATLVVDEELASDELNELENELSGHNLDSQLSTLRDKFHKKFERKFGLRQKGFSDQAIEFGKQALSNVLGGIGYFYGSSIAKNEGESDEKAIVLPPVGLFTATPSRVVFPRGFLWDEGFHQMIVQRWDPSLSVRCLLSWFDASQNNGWIPREQILGAEARSRFPAHIRHLMIQNPVVANPPSILMPLPMLWTLMRQTDPSARNSYDESWKRQSELLLKKSVRYYKWLRSTQFGKNPLSFRWRGRSVQLKSPDGYPLTLSSGLDDYPRSLRVSEDERHVDLHSWIAWSARLLARIVELDGQNSEKFWVEYKQLRVALDRYHTVPKPNRRNRDDMLYCDYDGNERICHEGYITILPFALGLLDVNDSRIEPILEALNDESILRSKAGVLSLSKSDRWHRRGDDYWTGSVWMPFNFLTLAALKTKYAKQDGPFREQALKTYRSLRDTIIQNTIQVYLETGQLWENYSPDDGGGKSSRQFTGWTSLVLMIMAEMFDGVA